MLERCSLGLITWIDTTLPLLKAGSVADKVFELMKVVETETPLISTADPFTKLIPDTVIVWAGDGAVTTAGETL